MDADLEGDLEADLKADSEGDLGADLHVDLEADFEADLEADLQADFDANFESVFSLKKILQNKKIVSRFFWWVFQEISKKMRHHFSTLPFGRSFSAGSSARPCRQTRGSQSARGGVPQS